MQSSNLVSYQSFSFQYNPKADLFFDCGDVEESLILSSGDKIPAWASLVKSKGYMSFDLSSLKYPFT